MIHPFKKALATGAMALALAGPALLSQPAGASPQPVTSASTTSTGTSAPRWVTEASKGLVARAAEEAAGQGGTSSTDRWLKISVDCDSATSGTVIVYMGGAVVGGAHVSGVNCVSGYYLVKF